MKSAKRPVVLCCAALLAAGLAGALLVLRSQPAKAATFTVTNTNDSGAGSLRDAITQANASPGFDLIAFNIPGAGPHTIMPLSSLPQITDPVDIDGESQPGYAGLPLIEIDGSALASSGTSCFFLTSGASGSYIHGLAINRFTGAEASAIRLYGSDNNYIYLNHLGTDPGGTAALGNSYGVFLEEDSDGNLIGLGVREDGNLISGNVNDGIHIKLGSDDNLILGNRIGTDISGTSALGNWGQGIDLRWNCTGNIVGLASVESQGNLISGNGSHGILILDAEGNFVQDNLIGTDVSGLNGLGNVMAGVALTQNSSDNVIGGAQGQRNVISGNQGDGVSINGGAGNILQNNFVGIGSDGTTPLGNTFEGVRLEAASGNLIGGDRAAGEGNLISANGWNGVRLINSDGNFVRGNDIGTAESGGGAGLGNGIDGVLLEQDSGGNTVGGDEPGFRNVISSNIAAGVRIDSGSADNTIRYNHIGTDLSGLFALGNGSSGIVIEDAESSGTVIGGPQGMGNLISGNLNHGIRVDETQDTLIEGNRIGTNAGGTYAIPNQGAGIWLGTGSSLNHIGTANEGGGNLISGNLGSGVFLDGSTGNEIIYSRIGTDPEAEYGIPNLAGGIYLSNGSDRNTISGNLIGYNGFDGIYILQSRDSLIGYNGIGDNAQDGVNIEGSPDIGVLFNAIMNNGEVGVSIRGNNSVGVAVVGNRIYNNDGLAIDLMRDGVTPNDGNNNNPAKPNRGYNFPVFDQAEFPVMSGIAQVSGTAPPNAYVEVYLVGPDPDSSGHGEGLDPLANTFADASGRFSVAVGGLTVGDRISAIAVSPEGDPSGEGNTSEFSANALIVIPEKTLGDTLWYVAEGSTGGGFDTWLLIANPGEDDAQAAVTFVTETGLALPVAVPVPAGSRVSLRENDHLPDEWSVSAIVESDRPVVVERSQ